MYIESAQYARSTPQTSEVFPLGGAGMSIHVCILVYFHEDQPYDGDGIMVFRLLIRAW